MNAALEGREPALREIHHRVKNNLAVIVSLLRLHSRQVSDGISGGLFMELQDRIRSMATAYELLYDSENSAQVNAERYITAMTNYLAASTGSPRKPVLISKLIEPLSLELDTAIPLGFIVTELVTNSLKHGLPDGVDGIIRISLRSIGGDEFELVVRDNGAGTPEDIAIETSSSLGLKLVSVFVRQLAGTIQINREGGTEVIVKFSEVPRRKWEERNAEISDPDRGG